MIFAIRRVVAAVVLAFVTASIAVGCGGGGGTGPSVAVEEANKPTSKAELKTRLTEIAASGAAGSATAGMRESIEELKATDAALAEGLLTDLDKLEAATSVAQVKTLATAMAGKL